MLVLEGNVSNDTKFKMCSFFYYNHKIRNQFLSLRYYLIFRSDKYVDWRAYDLELHKSSLLQLLGQTGVIGTYDLNVTLVGHNWGFLLGATIIKGL